jgi:hypothetical protein
MSKLSCRSSVKRRRSLLGIPSMDGLGLTLCEATAQKLFEGRCELVNSPKRVIFDDDGTSIRVDSKRISRTIPANNECAGERPTVRCGFLFELPTSLSQLFNSIDPLAAYNATAKNG